MTSPATASLYLIHVLIQQAAAVPHVSSCAGHRHAVCVWRTSPCPPRSLHCELLGTIEFKLTLNSQFLSFPPNWVFRILHEFPPPLLQRNNQAWFDLFKHIPGKGHAPGAPGTFSLALFLVLSLGQEPAKSKDYRIRELWIGGAQCLISSEALFQRDLGQGRVLQSIRRGNKEWGMIG